MQIINTTNINEARKQIEKVKKLEPETKIAILSQDDEFNRKALEIKGIQIFIINEDLDIKEYSKQRNSSLNEVLAKICKDKDILIAVELDKITQKNPIEKAKALARLKQNILLTKKTGAKITLLTKNQDKRAIQAILRVLNSSTKQAKLAIKQPF
jgi:RNase P/RNase MRP subunit p30